MSAYKKWSTDRKNMLDKHAISMIEARMQQEANELQLMEGWRAAARNSIRDKFVETRHRNTVVERHMDFIHTRDRLPPASMTSTQQLAADEAGSRAEDPLSPSPGGALEGCARVVRGGAM